jgi:hypothetical protein
LVIASSPLSQAASMVMAPVFFQQEETRIVAAPDNTAIDALPFVTSPGTSVDGVGALVVRRTDGVFLCTGSMIAPMWALTEAHCLSGTSGNVITTSVDSAFFPNASRTPTLTSGSGDSSANPVCNGAVGSGSSIALATYSLYTDSISSTPFAMVGFAERGDGTAGATLPAGFRRQGFNSLDYFLGPGVLIADFDNGNPMNDSSCSTGSAASLAGI